MIHSMTAFARQDGQGAWGTLTVELRSVNHRFLEANIRLPEELRALETELRNRINQALGRGKVDCFVRYQAPEAGSDSFTINTELAKQLAHASREIDALLYNPSPVHSIDLLRWPGVLQAPSPDPEQLNAEALKLLDSALAEMVENRAREGEKMREIILQRCSGMAEIVGKVRQRLPEVLQNQRERLQGRLDELKIELDPARLEQELVLIAQKVDVDEEMDRLATHVDEVRRVLDQSGPVGRRLDFLMQELNREANTLGSKSADTETTRASVDLKVLIEQMREQIQNIE